MRNQLILAALVVSSFASISALAQGRVEKPTTTTRPSETSAAQVRQCLAVAREIAELSDAADRADAQGDVDTFNATVDPYNSAMSRWNANCTRPYNPADMVRAENELGYRLCQYTQSPCQTEIERDEILMEEKRQLQQIQKKGQ